ncbi:hypothetical protein G9A89_009013 [Geosiphon pyriformis]|nr:hypothetical protein G9A89_009013 [Geosiphon pyriformis]
MQPLRVENICKEKNAHSAAGNMKEKPKHRYIKYTRECELCQKRKTRSQLEGLQQSALPNHESVFTSVSHPKSPSVQPEESQQCSTLVSTSISQRYQNNLKNFPVKVDNLVNELIEAMKQPLGSDITNLQHFQSILKNFSNGRPEGFMDFVRDWKLLFSLNEHLHGITKSIKLWLYIYLVEVFIETYPQNTANYFERNARFKEMLLQAGILSQNSDYHKKRNQILNLYALYKFMDKNFYLLSKTSFTFDMCSKCHAAVGGLFYKIFFLLYPESAWSENSDPNTFRTQIIEEYEVVIKVFIRVFDYRS